MNKLRRSATFLHLGSSRLDQHRCQYIRDPHRADILSSRSPVIRSEQNLCHRVIRRENAPLSQYAAWKNAFCDPFLSESSQDSSLERLPFRVSACHGYGRDLIRSAPVTTEIRIACFLVSGTAESIYNAGGWKWRLDVQNNREAWSFVYLCPRQFLQASRGPGVNKDSHVDYESHVIEPSFLASNKGFLCQCTRSWPLSATKLATTLRELRT